MATVKEKLTEIQEKKKRLAALNWIVQEIDQHLMGHDLHADGVPVEDEVISEVYGDIMETFVGPLEQEIETLLGEEV